MFAPLVAKPKSTGPQRAKVVDQAHTPRRDMGHQATTRFATPQASRTGDAPGTRTAASAAPSWDFSKIPIFPPGHAQRPQPPPLAPLPRLPIQAKLAVGSTDDPLEHEADRVADQVMRMPAPASGLSSAPPRVSRKCAACEAEDKLQKKEADAAAPARGLSFAPPQVSRKCAECEKEDRKLQKKEASPATPALAEAPPSVHDALRAPGQPLDAATRAHFEPRFGQDFSSVRVHTDTTAAQSARDVNAHAYTVGRNIAFGSGQFAPWTAKGQSLLAHELTHVVQQRAAPMLQRQPAGPDAAGGPSAAPGQAPCKPWPKEVPTRGRSELKPTGRDLAVEYSLAVTPGWFCEMPSKTLALVQYERVVRIRTQSGHEANLHIVADAGLFPPFDRTRSDFQQLRAPADASLKWEVAIRFGKDKYWDWLILRGAAGSVVAKLPRTQADLQSLAQITDTQPAFVHFFSARPSAAGAGRVRRSDR